MNKNLIKWKNKILRKVQSWRNSIVSKRIPQGNLEKIDLTKASIKEIKTKYFGRFRPSGFSRVLGVYKDKKLIGLILHYPTVWLEGKNEYQRLHINQKFEVIDSKGIYCEGIMGHPFPDFHAKYNVESIIRCRTGGEFRVRFFPADESPVFQIKNKEVRAVFVVYEDNKPKYFAPTLPLAGESVYDTQGKVKLKYEPIGFLSLTVRIVLEGIIKKYVNIDFIDKDFPKCLALFFAPYAISQSYYISPRKTIDRRNRLFGEL